MTSNSWLMWLACAAIVVWIGYMMYAVHGGSVPKGPEEYLSPEERLFRKSWYYHEYRIKPFGTQYFEVQRNKKAAKSGSYGGWKNVADRGGIGQLKGEYWYSSFERAEEFVLRAQQYDRKCYENSAAYMAKANKHEEKYQTKYYK